MSKAILVIDLPDCCNNCPCFDGMEDRSCCNVLEKDIGDILVRDKDCPLKSLPRRLNARTTDNMVISIGWNACLDEILGEEND